ncbi:MAG: hypothetical protein QOJ63_3450 [Solirubrobacteraceae bacterium]|nr:hypothetical protein [Solirubrobacteraceae bacterium]
MGCSHDRTVVFRDQCIDRLEAQSHRSYYCVDGTPGEGRSA